MPYPDDRPIHRSPLYVASIASLQGWDAPMLYNYSQSGLVARSRPEKWSTYHRPRPDGDHAGGGARSIRQGHVSPAKKTYCLMLDPAHLFDRDLTPDTSATIRTLAEQSKLTIGMPEVHELPWLKPSQPSTDVIVVTDPDHDFIPPGQSFVRSDTGELTRDWEQGIQTIDTPRTQAVSGWIGGKTLKTRDASFETSTKKAVVALTSVDNRPLAESRVHPGHGRGPRRAQSRATACRSSPSRSRPGSPCGPRPPTWNCSRWAGTAASRDALESIAR